MKPWPEYPCHSHTCGPACYGWPERYCEATSYPWYTAMWDRVTGRWYAVCWTGHKFAGRT